MFSRLRKYGLLCMVTVLLAVCLPSPPAKAAAQITIDSHQDGQIIAPGLTELQGTYSGVYDIELIVNGKTVTDVLMDDPNGDDSGTWSFKLDTTRLDGTAEVVLKSKDVVTRNGVWSPFIRLEIDNPAKNIPLVQITSPAENTLLNNKVNIKISAQGKNSIKLVQLRINGGEWQPVRPANSGYIYSWDTRQAANRVHSLEAKATDIYGNTGYSLTVYAKTGSKTSISQNGNEAVSDHMDVEDPLTTPNNVTDSVYTDNVADLNSETSSVYEEHPLLPDQDRSIWIWENASYHLVLNPNARHVLSSMAKDTSTFDQRPITTLYLGVDQYHGANMLEDYRTEVQNFVEWAHNEGFSIQALIAGGTKPPYFGAYRRYHPLALKEFEKVLNYNLASPESARFDGVNLDTEPYILPDFKTAKPSVQVQYLDMLKLLMERKRASGLTLPVGAAIPRWYDSSPDAANIPWNGETKWLSEHIQDTADYISIMDYRDQADGAAGIIAHATGELAYASRIGKPRSVVIGVETKDIADGSDPETISFQEEGRHFMEQELKKVYAAFTEDPSFGGVALHHYSSLLDFPSEWGPGGFKWTPPADREPPGAVSGAVTATAFDYQRIDITYGMAQDNTAVSEYRIYRGTEPAFEVGPETYAGSSEGLTFKDKGLLPDTTYYYKITAVDVSGNEGLPSEAVSATTVPSSLKPMIIGRMDISYAAGKASVTLQVVDMETNTPVPANVSGRFTHMAGKYIQGITNAEGVFHSQSEQVTAAQGEIGFLPRRIMADSYYWASAYDRTPYPTAVWSP